MRPSLIALHLPLSEEDEVFVERCFQRSLLVSVTREILRITCDLCGPPAFRCRRLTMFFFLVWQELEKLISFSGTPTCVWRRTGEICLVGDEFCLLTEWSKDELLDPHGLSASEDTASSAEENTPIVGCRKKFIYEVSSQLRIPKILPFQIRSLFLRPSACFIPLQPIYSADLFAVVREPIGG